MKRFGYFVIAVAVLAVSIATVASAATPLVTSAVTKTRLYNDAPGTTLNVVNAYPSIVEFQESGLGAFFGFANRHSWGFSNDGVGQAEFENNSVFGYSADVRMAGSGSGECGLRISPWWDPWVSGVFMLNANSGEIACFDARMPFYSFTAAYGITYAKGTVAHMAIMYKPNGLTGASPATIEYKVTIGGTEYASGPVAYNEGNPAEDPPHGVWGMLTPAYVGGYAMHNTGGFLNDENKDAVTTTFANICYTTPATPATVTTFGKVKALYR